MENTALLWIIGGLIIIAAAVAILFGVVAPRERSRRLREDFGPEYDRTIERHGDRLRAEADLRERRERVAGFRLRSLSESERVRYVAEWERIQARFVEEPSVSIREANRLVAEVMQSRGYPVRDPETQVKDLSVGYPALAENFRSAHAVYLHNEQGRADTEELRRAVVYYRGVFSELLAEESLRKSA
jgi:hypothetical protein